MKFSKLFAKIFVFRRIRSPWMQRWQRRLTLAFAALFPGVPQLLKKQIVVGSLLFVFGVGALLDLAICASFSIVGGNSGNSLKSFDLLYTRGASGLSAAFPDVTELTGEPVEHLTQPWFWHLLVGHILVYVVCAGISFWQQWKQTRPFTAK